MSKARIFISHSCKDVEIATGPSFEAEPDERLRRLKYAKYVRDEVVRLLSQDFEVWLDRKLLDPGDHWPIKLLRWLGECDAAVLLLSRDAIQSRWVLQEATVLTWRRHLRPDFRLIPVILGDLDRDQLATAGFGPLQISDIQAAKVEGPVDFSRSEADALALRIAGRFKDLAVTEEENALWKWVEDVASILQNLDESILKRACAPLHIQDRDWAHYPDRARTVAHYLLRANLDDAGKALDGIATALGARGVGLLATLVELVKPLWVNPAAAIALAEIRNGAWHAYAINTDNPDAAQDYARRAWCSAPWLKNRNLLFNEPVGEGQAHEIMAQLHDRVATRLQIKPAERRLLPRIIAKRPFFILFGDEILMDEDLCQSIAADETLGHATCVKLAGRDFGGISPGVPTILRLLPEIDDETEDSATVAKALMRELLPDSTTQP